MFKSIERTISMTKVTKQNLPIIVQAVLKRENLHPSDFENLALRILQSSAIDLSPPARIPAGTTTELIVVGLNSRQGIRTAGQQVNAFAFASVLLTAANPTVGALAIVSLLLGLLGACSANLSSEQAAFFLAVAQAEKDGVVPYAAAIAKRMGDFLNEPAYSVASTLNVVKGLRQLGVSVSVDEGAGQVIRHREAQIFLPGF